MFRLALIALLAITGLCEAGGTAVVRTRNVAIVRAPRVFRVRQFVAPTFVAPTLVAPTFVAPTFVAPAATFVAPTQQFVAPTFTAPAQTLQAAPVAPMGYCQ